MHTGRLASIIIPCRNQVAFTRLCLRSVFERTRPPFELILVDDGSDDGTGAYLAGVADASPAPAAVLSNPEPRGFPAAVNLGLRAARGDRLVLLNNDAVVVDGWLEQLSALCEAPAGEGEPEIGLAGPMSNYAAPPQLVEGAGYGDLEAMHAFAARWRAENRGRWLTTRKLSGFCLMMKRAVYEAVGGLDEGFGLGLFDDDDLAERAGRAGFACAVARDLFVHHFGSRTFVGEGIDAEVLLQENRAKFEAKWGVAAGRGAALVPWSGGPGVGAAARPRVSLTMIVRDEEANLGACLDSVAGLFDEVVVVDTGSADGTREIARARGAKVFEFAWIDDFAAARNAALAHASGDYAFWLDADDVVEPPGRAELESLLASLRGADPAAYVVRCACDPDERGGGRTVVDHVRLFPLRDDVRWAYRVHEQILPALRRAGVPVRWTDVEVRHTGYADSATRARKLERDVRILREELAARPDDPFVLFNLGSVAVERGEWAEASGLLARSLRGSAPGDSITRKLFALTARCLQQLGDPAGAVAACDEGLGAVGEDAELLFRKAVALRGMSRPLEAEACWRRILELRRPEEFSSVDADIFGPLTRRNLALLAEERGDAGEASAQWRAVLGERPGDVEAAWSLHRLDGPVAPDHVPWIVPGSRRIVVPDPGRGDFGPYAAAASAWVVRLRARVVVELGVRRGVGARALLPGVREADGHLWGVDDVDEHGIVDPRFTFVRGDAAGCVDRWPEIDLLHIAADPSPEVRTGRWLDLYAAKCRAIALHDAHRPASGTRRAVRAFVEAAPREWDVVEFWGDPSGWMILLRKDVIDASLVNEALNINWASF